jgi:hypothetical protein
LELGQEWSRFGPGKKGKDTKQETHDECALRKINPWERSRGGGPEILFKIKRNRWVPTLFAHILLFSFSRISQVGGEAEGKKKI